MNRNTRTFLVIGVAVAVAAVASVVLYGAIQRMPVREVEVARVHAVVGARHLPVGTMLTAADLKVVPWPAASPVAGGFSEIEPVVGRGLVAPMVENEPMTDRKLAPREAGAGLPPTIPAGMRALSVKVNEVIGVAGFVVPGTHVDVLATVSQQGTGGMSRVVVSNVTVLTAGTRYEQAQAEGGQPEPIQTTVVTLMVTPSDAERIALAASEGQIMLALRHPLDIDPTETTGIKLAQLMGEPAPPPVRRVVRGVPRLVPPPPPAPYTVEAIRAAKRTQEVVK